MTELPKLEGVFWTGLSILFILSLVWFPVSLFLNHDIPTSCSEITITSYDYIRALLPVFSGMAVLMLVIQLNSVISLGVKVGFLGPVSMWVIFEPLFGYMRNGVMNGGALLSDKSEYIFFSVVTLTTLGYGDMLPCASSRPFATTHALAGVLVVPLLVGWGFSMATSTKQ